jgi:ribosomal-protein-alanine N-acetyltransferase
VAEDPESGGVAAFAVASQIGPQAELESIVVATAHQRRGLARRLFTALLAEFEPSGVTEVLLEVRASNLPALRFYNSIGFVETGRRPGYYADPVEDALLLSLRLG